MGKLLFFALVFFTMISAYDVLADIDDGTANQYATIGYDDGDQMTQSFTINDANQNISVVEVYTKAFYGTYTNCGGLCISIEADNAGEPDENPIILGCNTAPTANAFNNVTMNMSYVFTANTTYWYRIWSRLTCGSGDAYSIRMYYTQGDKYTNGIGYYSYSNNTGNTWNGVADLDLRSFVWGGAASTISNSSTLTIHAPENTTYYNSSVPYQFEYTNQIIGNGSYNSSCGYWLDGSLTWLGSQANNTNVTGTLNASLGAKNLTVFCGDGDGGNTTSQQNFTVGLLDFTNSEYNSTTYELNYYDINTTFRINPNETTAAFLHFNINGTQHEQEYSSQTGEYYSIGYSQLTPFLEVNNSNQSIEFNLTITYNNGTNQTFDYSNGTQTIMYSSAILNFTTSPDQILSGETFNFTIEPLNQSDLIAHVVWTQFNGTNQTATLWGTEYKDERTAPVVYTSTNYTSYAYMNVTYGGTTYLRTFDALTVSIYYINVTWSSTTCPAGYYPGLNFTFHDEENTTTTHTSDMDALFNVWNADRTAHTNTTVNATGVDYITVCFEPSEDFWVDSFQLYGSNGWNQRAYYLLNASVDPATTYNISLYLSNSTLNKLTQFSLTGADSLPYTNGYIIVERYYLDTNQYAGVSHMLTDENGESTTYLTPNNVYYIYKVVDAYSTDIETFRPSQTIFCSPSADYCTVALTIGSDTTGKWWTYTQSITHSCETAEIGDRYYITCEVTDTSGLINSFELATYSVGMYANHSDCFSYINSSSGTISCNISNSSTETAWILTAKGSSLNLDGGSIFRGVNQYGMAGPMMAFAITGGLAFFGAALSPGTTILMTIVGVTTSVWVGFVQLNAGALIGLIVLGLFLAKKVVD